MMSQGKRVLCPYPITQIFSGNVDTLSSPSLWQSLWQSPVKVVVLIRFDVHVHTGLPYIVRVDAQV